MRYSTASGMILAAMTVGDAMAGPTHAHLHRRAHQKKDVDYSTVDWAALDINWAAAYSKGIAETATTAAVAAASPIVAAEVKASTTPAATTAAPTQAAASVAAAASSVISDLEGLFDNLVGAANKLTAFGTAIPASGCSGDDCPGNYGVPYGSNALLVSSIEGQSYTITFTNTQSSTITVNIWNKVGPDLQILSGSALAPKSTTLTFTLAPGASQIVAFQENSQIAWAESCSATTASGAFQTTWGEANFISTGSGYDVSAINDPSNSYAMTIKSTQATQCTSSTGATKENYWLNAATPIGTSDGSCYIAQSTANLQVTMGS